MVGIGWRLEHSVELESSAIETRQIFKLPVWICRVVSIGFVFRAMNFVAENVSHHQFLYETGLKQVLETVFCGNLLRFANVVDDLGDVIH